MITSKRHPFKFYLTLVFGFSTFVVMGSVLFHLYYEELKMGQIASMTKIIPLFGVFCFGLAIYTIYQYLDNVPKIRVTNESISFNEKTLSFTDLEEITLSGKFPFRYILNHPMEGAMLLFKNGTKKYFFDDMYSNSSQIKSFLEKTVLENEEYVVIQNTFIRPDSIRFERAEDFKGNQFTSLPGITLWGVVAFMFSIFIFNGKFPTIEALIFFSCFGGFWFLFNSWLMHYFSLTENHFVVKNHNLIWRQHIYRLKDIKEVTFETQGKLPNSLRVITKDFQNKLYPASTLRNNTWKKLEEKLTQRGIIVRNENILL